MERKISKILIYGLITLIMAGNATYNTAGAQEYVAPPVSISKDKVKIDGKVFYSHIVLERQTLYSISKAYNVSIEDIYKYNPSVKESGLQKNAIINIPVVAEVQEEQPTVETAASGERRHTVKWYEDLPTIASKYNVSESEIIKANNLTDGNVKNKQVLIIPDAEPQAEPQADNNTETPETSFEAIAEEVIKEETAYQEESTELDQYSDSLFVIDYWNQFKKPKLNVTLILPFKATGKSSNRNNMDFYSGVLLAAKEATNNGTNIHLNVYDIAAGVASIDKETLKESHIIIGPVSPTDIEQIATLTNGECPIVSPLDQRAEKLTSKYSNIIQAPASQHAQFTDLTKWLMEDTDEDDKVIVISEKEARQNDAGGVLKSIIDRTSLSYTPFSYSILEGRNIQSSLEAIMTKTGTNRVVIASESEAFVNDAVRNLNLIVHKKFDLVLYAPAKIRSFETIEVENFHNTSLHASMTYFIDYHNDDLVKAFILRYRGMFKADPTQFAFQGYDLAKYFIELITAHPANWASHLDTKDAQRKMLQNLFKFHQNGTGSYSNKGIRRIIYNKDYSIEDWTDKD